MTNIFYCKYCKKPLEIDESILDIDEDLFKKESLEELEGKIRNFESFNIYKMKEKTKQNENNNFSIKNGNLLDEKKIEFIHNLFEICSNQIGIELPLCKECTQKHLKNMENQVSELMKENFIYKSKFNNILESNNDELIKDEEKLDLEIKSIEEEENHYKENLNKFLEERRILNLEMEVLQQESKKINEMEEKYWKIFNQYHEELTEFCENYDTIKRKIINVKENLEILKQTDIFNDTFHIWYDGHFATINGFRLGRLPSQPVDWNEINAAWGQACLLLYTISKKLNFQFSTFKILPLGSYSKIERINDKSSYELYGSNDISLGKIFWYRRFDNGMVAFLQCLNEIIHFIESKDKNFKVPYNIEKDKIGEMSIKIQFNNEEIWTKALKYMLTNMKYILVWLAKQNIS